MTRLRLVELLRTSLFAAMVLAISQTGLAADPETEVEPDAEEAEVDRYAIPETDDPAKLLEFIDSVESFQPTDRKTYFEHRLKGPQAIITAAKQVLELEKDKTSDAYKRAAGHLAMQRAQTITRATPAEQQQILQDVLNYLSNKELTGSDIRSAISIASGLEHSGNTDLAATAYSDFGALLKKNENPQIAAMAEMFAGASRRLNLPGNQMELTGTTVDGKPFDLADMKGKTVLVDFWATWCGPCIAEYPNILRNYEAYHDKGFEVVGVSLDADRAALEKYLAEKEVPWVTLHSNDENGQHPAAKHYGIIGIPSMILIGDDGKVVSLSARGEELNRLLEEKFGKPAKEPAGE